MTPTEQRNLSRLKLYASLLSDFERARIAAGNRRYAFTTILAEGGAPQAVIDAETGEIDDIVDAYGPLEHELIVRLEHEALLHPLWAWAKPITGIGPKSFGRLMGLIGDPQRFETPAQLWKYLGLHVVDGHKPKREYGVIWTHTNCTFECPRLCKHKGEPDHDPRSHHKMCVPNTQGTAYNPLGAVRCHVIAESLVRLNRGSYRHMYDRQKAYYTENREWTPKHCDLAARRYMVKALVLDLWKQANPDRIAVS